MKKNVTLGKEHIKAVEEFGQEMGLRSFSVALQVIITQFSRMRGALVEAGGPPMTLLGPPPRPAVEEGADGKEQ